MYRIDEHMTEDAIHGAEPQAALSETPSVRKEVLIVLVLALGSGLVGIDRFLISTMFPVIARDLNIGYGAIGTITGALALSWGLAALVMGNLSDRIGRRDVICGSLLLFSLLIGASGLAAGLYSLVIVRLLMGLADGAFTPVAISATIEASPRRRQGRNVGIQQMTMTLFGLGLAPMFVSWMLHTVDWRWVFAVFIVPGLLLTLAAWHVLPPDGKTAAVRGEASPLLASWRMVIGYRNIRVITGIMLCCLTVLVTISALFPSYLLDHLKLDFGAMSLVMSAIGFGASAGTMAMPWLSDRLGRRTVVLLCTVGTACAVAALSLSGPSVALLFTFVFIANFFNNGLMVMTIGPLCALSVPPTLIATASGLIIAVGEFFGGGFAMLVAGHFAEHFGIAHLMVIPLGASVLAVILGFTFSERRFVV